MGSVAEGQRLFGVNGLGETPVDDLEVQRVTVRDLSGVVRGNQPKKPFRAFGQEARSNLERFSLCGNLGTLCEHALLPVWQDWQEQGCPETKGREQLAQSCTQVRSQLRENLGDWTWKKASDIASFYQDLAAPSVFHWEPGEKYLPENQALRHCMQEVDLIYGIDMAKRYHQLATTTVGGRISDKVRYWVETVLILTKEAVDPSLNKVVPGGYYLYPDVCYASGLVQYDAVLVRGEQPFQARFSVSGGNGRFPQVASINPHILPISELDWEIVEMKVPFRPAKTTGKRTLSQKPINKHLEKLFGRLGLLALYFDEVYQQIINFPKAVTFLYLRGYRDHAIFRIDLNQDFLRRWLENEAIIAQRRGGVAQDLMELLPKIAAKMEG
ncbi:hypothetical protein ACFLZP_01695 [Patescibacteria group bacterium]